MTEAQRRAILACFRLSTWDWVRLADLLRALATDSEALDARSVAASLKAGSITTLNSMWCAQTAKAEPWPDCRRASFHHR